MGGRCPAAHHQARQPASARHSPEGRRHRFRTASDTKAFPPRTAGGKACNTFDALVNKLRWINESCDPPLPGADVVKTACSAWHYEQANRNFVGRGKSPTTPDAMFKGLISVPGGLTPLFCTCCCAQHTRPAPNLPWRPRRWHAIRHCLSGPMSGSARRRTSWSMERSGSVSVGGGSGPRDPAQFCFAEDVKAGQFSLLSKGKTSLPNT